jgi:uncharacterized membrane protein
MRNRSTMPRWPAYVMGAFAAACAYPAMTNPPPATAAGESYEARGNEPGWHVLIANDRIDYVGDYGETRIAAARPDPRPSFNGRRYVADKLAVDLTYSRCNDDLNGFGYEHQVLVTAKGKTYRGCGGARRTDWDI